MPLFPEPITVKPDPRLLIKYFWPRQVYADDPFTDVVEPSVPFYLVRTIISYLRNKNYCITYFRARSSATTAMAWRGR